MKFVRCLSAVLSILFLAGCSKPQAPAKLIDVGPPIEAPVTLDDALVTLTVSDLHGFLDGAGSVVSQISPMMGGPLIKTLIGSKLGDPQLAGIAPSNGLAVVMLSPTDGFAAAEVQAAQIASYIQGVQAAGLVAKQQGGLLLIAKDAAQLAAAEPLAAKVQTDLLGAKREASLRLSMQPSALVTENEELLTSGLQKMLTQMKQASGSNDVVDVQKILEAELQVFLSLGRQVASAEVTLAPVDGAIHLSKIVQPVAGSRLAAYCNAPALNDYNPQVQPGILPDGVVEMEFCMRNPDALLAFFNDEVAALSEKMELDPAIADGWAAYMTRWMDAMGSTVCESIFTDERNPFGVAALADVGDEEAMRAALRGVSADLESMGFFQLYESVGMPMTIEFEENVREAAGLPVHRLTIDYALENVPAEQREAMESIIGDMVLELAFYKDVLIYSMGGEEQIEKMIDQLKNPVEPSVQLAARTALPSGGFYYADFNMAGYFRFISSFAGKMPDASGDVTDVMGMIGKFTAVMQGAEPIVMSGYCNSGRMKFCSQLPADLLVRVAQAGQMLAMEAMQKKSAMPSQQKEQ